MRFAVRIAIVALAAAAAVPGAVASSSADMTNAAAVSGSEQLFKRMEAVNEKLRTYTATVHMDAKMKSFPFLSTTVEGVLYFKQPDHQAVVFDTVPALAAQFRKVYPKIEPPAAWSKTYDVTPISNQDGVTTFRLIPKKNGRVEHLDVSVDDANATIKAYTWTYKDGGSIEFEQSVKTVGSYFLPDTLTGHVDIPSYKAEVTSHLSNFKENVPVDDAVFEEK